MPVVLSPAEFSKPHTRFGFLLFWAFPLILAVMVGTFTLDGGFVQDDKAAILISPLVQNENISLSDFFYRDSWGFPGSENGTYVWRPLLPMIWRLVWVLQPGSSFAYRFLTLLLHLTATGMVLLLGYRLLRESTIVWAAAALFAVHPLHAEALGTIVGQADILAALLGMIAIYVALEFNNRSTPFLVLGVLILACLAKESAVVFSAAIVVVSLMHPRMELRRRLAVSFCAALVTILTVLVQMSLKRAGPDVIDNIGFAAHGVIKLFHALYVIGRAVGMCFVPNGMSPFHDYAAVDLSLGTLLPYAIPGLLFLCLGIGAFFISLKRRSIPGVIGTGLLLGPVIINSSLIVSVGTELAERLLYPATIAASGIAAFLIFKAAGLRLGRVAIVVLVLLFSVQSWSAQRPWRNQLDLYAHGAANEPLSARLHAYYAVNLLFHKQVLEAAWHLMARTYIIVHFPNRVDPLPIEQLEQLQVEQRLLEGPAVFRPEDPCGFLGDYYRHLQTRTPKLEPYMRNVLSEHYTACTDPPSVQTTPAKPEE